MAAYAITFTKFPAYTGSLATLTSQLTKALSAIDNNSGRAGPNLDATRYQQVISKFFFENSARVSAISVTRNDVFLGYVDAKGYTDTDPSTVNEVKGMTKVGNTDLTVSTATSDIILFNTALTAARNVALPAVSFKRVYTVTRAATATGAFALTVKSGATTLWTASAEKAWAQFASDGTNWFLVAQGTLP